MRARPPIISSRYNYHRAVAEAVGRFDGFVAKYMGDGVLIYFGYPQAHEDDAEQAARAGLAAIEAIGQLPAGRGLSVRLGIATGLAVVGDLIGEGAAQERAVIGGTPNLAARLQALAGPNTLIIAEATRRQIGGLFDFEDLGPQALAGFGEAQRAWRVLGESGEISRFEALRSGETPLVGREEEVELLVRRWQQAKSGEGRVVLVSGEPGSGKSRLTAALSQRIESELHTRLRYFCSPHDQDSALYPFIEKQTDTRALMEINGRFWGSLPLAYHAGARFAWLTYSVLGLNEIPTIGEYRNGITCRYMIPEMRRVLRIIFNPRSIKDRTLTTSKAGAMTDCILGFFRPSIHYYIFSFNDPMPFVIDMKEMIYKGFGMIVTNARSVAVTRPLNYLRRIVVGLGKSICL